jgi:hypothetical protein
MKLSPAWKKAATALLIAAAAFFLVTSIARDWPRIRAFDWHVDPLLLAASIALLVAMLVWGVWVWGTVLRRFEHAAVPFGTLLRIWFVSNLARYIPGTVFQFLTAAQLSRSAGLSAAVLLTSLLVHTGITLLSALVVSAWTLPAPLFPALPPAAVIAIGVAATVLAAGLVHPRVLNGAIGIIPRLLKREVIRWNGSWGYGLVVLAMSLVSWAMYGSAYWMFLRSLTPMSPAHLPMVSGVNALSFAAGWIVFFAPGGLGVREYAMNQLLLPILPSGVAALISIAARLWNITGELLGSAVVLALFRRASRDGAVGTGTPPSPAAEVRKT